MTFFAFLPAIARAVGGVSPWTSEWVVESANYMSSFYGDPYVLFDGGGSFGMVMAGAYFGAYYGMRRAAWKRLHWGVAAPILGIFAIILASAVAPNMVGGWLCGEVAELTVTAIRDVGVGVVAVVLGANIGWWRGANNVPKWGFYIKECALLYAIFMGSLVVVYVQNVGGEPCDSGYVILDHTALLTGLAVAGAALGAHYGSYKLRYEDCPWFRRAAAAVLGSLIAAYLIIEHFAVPRYQDISWMCVLALTSVGIGLAGNQVGEHITALLKKRGGAD